MANKIYTRKSFVLKLDFGFELAINFDTEISVAKKYSNMV